MDADDGWCSYRVPKFHTFLMWLLRAGTAVVGYGLYEIQTRDVGLTESKSRIQLLTLNLGTDSHHL